MKIMEEIEWLKELDWKIDTCNNRKMGGEKTNE